MTRFRILIQNRDDGDKFIASFPFDTENIDMVVNRLKNELNPEMQAQQERLQHYVLGRQKTLVEELMSQDEDLIDWESKGKDISRKKFLENELWFARFE